MAAGFDSHRLRENKLDAKLADMLTELVALKILQVQVGE